MKIDISGTAPVVDKRVTLYKFMEARYAMEAFEALKLKVSQPENLNDPYEVNPVPQLGLGLKVIKEFLRVGQARTAFCEKFGIISFSAVCNDPVLWAHYADNFKGIALEFKWPANANLIKVVYQPDRPTVQPATGMPLTVARELIKTKWESWRYENEYRLLCELSGCSTNDGHFFKSFAPTMLARVILGYKCTTSPVYIKKAFVCRGLSHVTVANAVLSRRTYRIEVQ